MPAFFSASIANGLMRPLGALPALCALTSLRSLAAQWFSMPSLSTLRAELCVHRISTCVVMRLRVVRVGGSAARRLGCGHRNADRLAARRRRAAGRCGRGLLRFAEHRDVAQRVEVLPGDTLRIGDPVLLAARIAACGLALVEQRHVGGLGACLHDRELLGVVSLEAEVIDARFGAARGDGEVDARIVEHPLRVVTLDPRGGGREQLRIEADALVEVLDMHVDVKSLHGYSRVNRWCGAWPCRSARRSWPCSSGR